MRHGYELKIAVPRALTPEELERVIRAAVETACEICEVPATAERRVSHKVALPAAEAKAA